jgi:protein-disulfide isomerase
MPPSKPRGITREARILMIGSALIVGVTVGIGFAMSSGTEDSAAPTAVVEESRLVRSDSPTLGPADAPVTLVEFLDPECESCRAAHPAIKEIMINYEGRVRLVVRYFPLHTNSVLAALATEAAGQQGRYWEMQDLLFERQPEWGEQRTETPEVFIAYAETLGLDMAQFRADMQNLTYLERIERDRADGQALGVNGTPTFFVNGELVEPLSYARLVQMIDEALSEASG